MENYLYLIALHNIHLKLTVCKYDFRKPDNMNKCLYELDGTKGARLKNLVQISI